MLHCAGHPLDMSLAVPLILLTNLLGFCDYLRSMLSILELPKPSI